MDKEAIYTTFKDTFGIPDVSVFAPGRANIIGEHTDYNDGFVLPMAIDHAIWLALRPRNDKTVRLFSPDLEADSTFELDSLAKGEGWVERDGKFI